MKTNRTIILFVIALVLIVVGSIMLFKPPVEKPELKPVIHPTQKKEILIYFSKMKGSEIVTEPVKRPMPTIKSKEYLLEYAISELLKGPTEAEQEAGYFSEIPAGTKLLSVQKTPQGLHVNLSGEFSSGGGSNSMLLRLEEMTKTVASLSQSDAVYLAVEGKQLDVLGGEGVIVKEPITESPTVQQ